MGVLSLMIQYIAPPFIITSPITSYADQIRSMHVQRSSRGFSLDTPLIMLVSSILRVFYWFGADFQISLLIQAILTIAVQITLLKVALDHRPPPDVSPFSAVTSSSRPYGFWQWRSQRPYWTFLVYFVLGTAVMQLLLGKSQTWVDALGYIALGIEATLPLPQVFANEKGRSCQGFRLSVLTMWLIGDAMKMIYFFTGDKIGTQFKLCAGVQMVFDMYLGVQFLRFGAEPITKKEEEMKEMQVL
ncbi:hypothetical protein BZA77DRAFT_325454 [Pyronema omphalodes]|nr:hypothetical protein BZA77DRAFT_325454 [Pyronema omphalodes]